MPAYNRRWQFLDSSSHTRLPIVAPSTSLLLRSSVHPYPQTFYAPTFPPLAFRSLALSSSAATG